MSDFNDIIPHILKWEVGLRPSELNLPPERMFASVAARGYHCIPGDKGGHTMCGVTLATYRTYVNPQGTVEDLRKLSFDRWRDILKARFWDPCRADSINNHSVALMLVDWRWVNGTQAIRDAQSVLSLVPDGIVGPKTIAALNDPDSEGVFNRLRAARIRAYNRIVERSPSQKKFLKGWINRTESIRFSKE